MDFLDTKDNAFVKSFFEKIKQLENDPFALEQLEIKRFKNDKKRFMFKIDKETFYFEVMD
jgi:hypothetical protein